MLSISHVFNAIWGNNLIIPHKCAEIFNAHMVNISVKTMVDAILCLVVIQMVFSILKSRCVCILHNVKMVSIMKLICKDALLIHLVKLVSITM